MTIQDYNDIYKNPIVKKMRIETSGGITITNSNICSEQMSLEESICSDDNLIYGSCESGCFKIRIADLNHNFEGEWIDVYQYLSRSSDGYLLLEDGSYLLMENGDKIFIEENEATSYYGRYKVFSDKPTNDRRWRDLVCYDAMHDILNADVFEWYDGLTFPMTMKNFRDSFFTYLGITQEATTLVNDTFPIQGGFSNDGALSGKTIITSICELNGAFGHMSREGKFEYITLDYAATPLELDWYIDGSGAYEDYLTDQITGIIVKSSEDDVGTEYVISDSNVYIIQDNPLTYGSEGSQALLTALNNLFNLICNFYYRPYKVNTYGNPMLPLGTRIKIDTKNQTIYSIVMSRVLSGIQNLVDNYSARGAKSYPSQVNSLRSETKRTKGKIHELVNDVDTLSSTIEDLDERVESEITQLADTIVLKVDASGNIVKVALSADPSTGSTFAVNADNITFTAGSVLRFTANNIVIDSTNFQLDANGNLACTNGNFSGTITSTNGTIGGWSISSTGLEAEYELSSVYNHFVTLDSQLSKIIVGQNHTTNGHAKIEIDYSRLFSVSDYANSGTDYYVFDLGYSREDNHGDSGYLTIYDKYRNRNITTDATNGLMLSDNNQIKKRVSYDGFFDDNFDANRVLVSNGSKYIASSSITATQLNNVAYLDNATGNIQGQIDGVVATLKNSPHNGFTKDGSTSGKYIDVDGVEKSHSAFKHTNYIEIPKWAKSVITYNTLTLSNTDYPLDGPRFALYDSNKTWIETQNGNYNKGYIISDIDGSTARYIIVNYGNTTANENDSVCIFLPHEDESPYSIFDLVSKTVGGYIGDDGNIVSNSSIGYTDYIEVPKWAKSVVTYNSIGTGTLYPLSGAQFATYNSNKTFIENVKGNTNLGYVITDIDGTTVRYIRVDFGKDNVLDCCCIFLPQNNIQANVDSLTQTVNNLARSVHPNIYGVKWDWANSNSPTLTRTDMSSYFAEPSPAVSNGTGTSPFDVLYPWSGMKVVEDAEAGSLVAIPKFWYKMTNDNGLYTLQIADAPVEGFYVSPAHMDRGDGKGERDVIYVGRYHCDSNYKSTSGVMPITSITRATARANISALGSTIWQYDYFTMCTIKMLYLVEFADFNSQGKIGYGCSPSGALFNMGYTDSMQYHTGTDASSRTTYGGTQYRHIEGLWDNVVDFVDGIYYGWSTTNLIKNPSQFAESGGTNIGTKVAAGGASSGNGQINNFGISTTNGFVGIPYATSKGGDAQFNKYTCDYAAGRNYGVILVVGGNYIQNQSSGLFLENAWYDANGSSSDFGCRVIKLP